MRLISTFLIAAALMPSCATGTISGDDDASLPPNAGSQDSGADSTVNDAGVGSRVDATLPVTDAGHDASVVDSGHTPPKKDSGVPTPVPTTTATTPVPVPTGTTPTPVPTATTPVPVPTTTATTPVPVPPPGSGTFVGGCMIYPSSYAWNTDVSNAPLAANAAALISKMDPGRNLHADWGTSSEGYGIPYNIGTGAPQAPINFTLYGSESDPSPYPIPVSGIKIESPNDSHLLYLDNGGAPNHCMLYELWQATATGSGYNASCGAVFHMDATSPRPVGWTSADAAGLAILPGLVKYSEIQAGVITHAIRFTLQATYNGYVAPATHAAGYNDVTLPPMGARVRLQANVDISGFSKEAQVVLVAMKKYGMILADNGSNWYISGDQNDGWASNASDGNGVRDSVQKAFNALTGASFEVVDSGPTTKAQ